MKWTPTQVGAEPKKLAVLAVLLVGAGVAYWYSSSSPSGTAIPAAAVPASDPAALKNLPAEVNPSVAPSIARDTGPMPFKRTTLRGGSAGSRSGQEFRPSMKAPDDFDVSSVDPAIRWDLLAKVREVPAAGGARSLFEFSKPPEPPPPPVQPIKVPLPAPAPPVISKAAEPPKPPPPPPIPLKYYGYSGKTRDFGLFLDNDSAIFVAKADQTVKNRYKVIRLGMSSAVLEDTATKDQQTLPIVEDPPQ